LYQILYKRPGACTVFASTQFAAPSSTNAVVEEVATHGGVSEKKTPGVPQHSEQTPTG